jgi:hypothetical protein
MSGTVAGQLGIANFVFPAHEVEATALNVAQDLSTGPTRSYAAIRTLLKAGPEGGVPSADAMILDLTMARIGSEDPRRGRTARAEAIQKELNRLRLRAPVSEEQRAMRKVDDASKGTSRDT